MVITRTNGIDDAGVFSIAYSIASMMLFIGEFGVRKYQASDVSETNSFSDYYTFRIISCACMMAACLLYGVYGMISLGYSREKFWVLIMVCIVRAIEAYNDVFFGRFQQLHRLDVSAKTSIFRMLFGMFCYTVALIITHHMLVSAIIWVVSHIVGYMLSTHIVYDQFCRIEIKYDRDAFKRIFTGCFPLFLANFLLLYIGNAPKYAIDAMLNEEIQARYNFIFMPVFVINMFANFIFNPIIVDLADAWTDREYKKFRHIVYRQVAIIGGFTVLAIIVALTIGCPVLGALYNIDLSDLKPELVILMVGGGMLAMVNFLTVVITIIRKQQHFTWGYILIALMAMLLANSFVRTRGLSGAAALYTVLMAILAAVFSAILVADVKRGYKEGAL